MAMRVRKAKGVRESNAELLVTETRPKRRITKKLLGKIAIWIFATAVIATPNFLYSQAGIAFTPVLNESMHPITNRGDVLLTKEVAASTLKAGDIVTVYNQIAGTYYSHRIVDIKTIDSALNISTKGDSNSTIDPAILVVPSINAVQKEYLVLPPWLGRVMVFLWSSRGHQVSSIFLASSYVLVIFLFLFRKKIKANFGHEKVYKELYSEERAMSEHYKNVIFHLKEIETEKNLIQKSR